jgi:hypothetical protein
MSLRVVDCLQNPSKCSSTAFLHFQERNHGIDVAHYWEYRDEIAKEAERMAWQSVGGDNSTYVASDLPRGQYTFKFVH